MRGSNCWLIDLLNFCLIFFGIRFHPDHAILTASGISTKILLVTQRNSLHLALQYLYVLGESKKSELTSNVGKESNCALQSKLDFLPSLKTTGKELNLLLLLNLNSQKEFALETLLGREGGFSRDGGRLWPFVDGNKKWAEGAMLHS